MKNRVIYYLLVLLFYISLTNTGHTQEIKIRVSVKEANVRLSPDHSSTVISMVTSGLEAEVIKKEGEWYFVELPPNEKGVVIAGYLHQCEVEKIKVEQKQEETKEKKVNQEEKINAAKKFQAAEKEVKIKKQIELTAKEEKTPLESSIKIISVRRTKKIKDYLRYHTAKDPEKNVLLVLRINNISEEEFDSASKRKEIYITSDQSQHTPGITHINRNLTTGEIHYNLIFSVPRTITQFKLIISDYSVLFKADKEISDQLSFSELNK